MRNRTFILLLFVVAPSILSAEVFKGEPSRVQGSAMVIRWETVDETAVSAFVIVCREVRSGVGGLWRDVGRKNAMGGGSIYTIEDTEIFKSADRILEYEIRAINSEGQVVDWVPLRTIYSSGLTSAVRRTWGSIKAMFR
jgi:hypothetical protein